MNKHKVDNERSKMWGALLVTPCKTPKLFEEESSYAFLKPLIFPGLDSVCSEYVHPCG
jgi:hypothetical protein